MRRINWLAGFALAGMASCALAADVKISAMASATLPDDTVKLSAVQGSGCATSTTPCSNVAITTGALASYLAAQSSFTTAYRAIGTPLALPTYTVSTLPSAAVAGKLIYISNESGGAVVAFSDGTNWRRVTDRAIVS